jgi:hypothetical protein
MGHLANQVAARLSQCGRSAYSLSSFNCAGIPGSRSPCFLLLRGDARVDDRPIVGRGKKRSPEMFGVEVVNSIFSEIGQSVIRAITGRLFTKEQIDAIVRNSVGKHFADLFPTAQDERDAIERVAEAEAHITQATAIVTKLQVDLNSRSETLRALIAEIEDKQKLAQHYETLASAGEKQTAAIRSEMEKVIRQELIAQANKGRHIRQAASFAIWLFTLVVGAALGTYFPDIVKFLKTLIA